MTMKELLEAAIQTVADRGEPYGGVEDNFTRIAMFWNVHIQNRYGVNDEKVLLDLDATDVAMMMILLKLARLANASDHMDSWIDIAGYAACGGSMTSKQNSA